MFSLYKTFAYFTQPSININQLQNTLPVLDSDGEKSFEQADLEMTVDEISFHALSN